MKKECGQCGKGFEVSDEDLAFYGGLSPEVPPPSLCFFCRHQKRLAFRNEINLYHRKCDFSGEKIISMYSPDKEYRVYDQHIWWSDKWDPLEYGRDYDFNRGFFEQYAELQKEVPRMSFNNINAENSDYCNLALDNKDCYLIFTADNNEKCAYLRFSDKNYACFDCDYTYDSIECYECLDVEKGNRCLYCHKCVNSSGLVFCYNMIGCHDCIGCANLRNKRYYIFNREYSKSEFDKKRAELGWSRLKSEYAEFLRSQPRKYLDIVNCENSLGDNLRDCKNAYMCYNSVGLEDCRYMMNCYFAKDCYDWDFVAQKGSERCHEMASCAYNMVNCHFCSGCWENCSDFYYCELCLNSSDLFGCISLRHKKYCILNKQYSREEYFELRGRIIEKMRADGEWGEFFPYSLSTYAYNETVAGEYFPLDEAEVLKRGWKWHEEEEGGGGLKIIDIERKFCEKVGVPLPKVAWKERQRLRMKLRNPWMLWARKCDKCGADIRTTYEEGRPEPVYCEKCYESEVY